VWLAAIKELRRKNLIFPDEMALLEFVNDRFREHEGKSGPEYRTPKLYPMIPNKKLPELQDGIPRLRSG
jgi:hypothetical protein